MTSPTDSPSASPSTAASTLNNSSTTTSTTTSGNSYSENESTPSTPTTITTVSTPTIPYKATGANANASLLNVPSVATLRQSNYENQVIYNNNGNNNNNNNINNANNNINISAFPPLKNHFSTPEGKYILKEDSIYMHPTGRLFHASRWWPVKVSFISFKYKTQTASHNNEHNTDYIMGGSGGGSGSGLATPSVASVNGDADEDVPHFKTTSEPTHSSTLTDDGSNSAPSTSTAVAAAATAAATSTTATTAHAITNTTINNKQQQQQQQQQQQLQENDPNNPTKKKSWSIMGFAKSAYKAISKTAGRAADRPKDGFFKESRGFPIEGVCIVYNVGRYLIYHDYFGSAGSISFKNPIETDLFVEKTHASCHDFNQLTRSNDSLELVIGVSTGAIIIKDSVSNTVKHINQDLSINKTKVTNIKWVPGSENIFIASHLDGELVVYDKDRQDPVPVAATNNTSSGATSTGANDNHASINLPHISDDQLKLKAFVVHKNSSQIVNPVSKWRIGNSVINDFAFSPDCKHLAVVNRDGGLRVFDFEKEELLMLTQSYFGGLLAVCWSPDGKYILTGGEDDLVSLWSFQDKKLVARGEGHSSWVSAVAFDPFKCDGNTLRFGSGGQDSRVLLWEYSVPSVQSVSLSSSATHHTPNKTQRSSSIKQTSLSSTETRPPATTDPQHSLTAVPMLLPIVSHKAHYESVTSLVFREDALVSVCHDGMIKLWIRPEFQTQRADEDSE